MEDRLVFVIGPPRSGSTLLARMLGAHPEVFAPAEPHLLTPLAHLGYHERVERAPYDPFVTQEALRELVRMLPRGEVDYLEAMRGFTDGLYTRLLATSGRRLLVDKTPAYALVLDFVGRLYPRARYVVLTRHPFAIWSSFVESFFDGDPEVAHAHNPLLERYVPAIARFLRERPVPLVTVRYESLVQEPEATLTPVCAHLGIAFDPRMVRYGEAQGAAPAARGLGDPVTVSRETRPTTASLGKWAKTLAAHPAGVTVARRILESLADEDLAAFGRSRAELERDLASAAGIPARPAPWLPRSRHALERRVLVALRRNIQHNAFGRLVRRVRFFCDVLLR